MWSENTVMFIITVKSDIPEMQSWFNGAQQWRWCKNNKNGLVFIHWNFAALKYAYAYRMPEISEPSYHLTNSRQNVLGELLWEISMKTTLPPPPTPSPPPAHGNLNALCYWTDWLNFKLAPCTFYLKSRAESSAAHQDSLILIVAFLFSLEKKNPINIHLYLKITSS